VAEVVEEVVEVTLSSRKRFIGTNGCLLARLRDYPVGGVEKHGLPLGGNSSWAGV